jgi:hypothetical protein
MYVLTVERTSRGEEIAQDMKARHTLTRELSNVEERFRMEQSGAIDIGRQRKGKLAFSQSYKKKRMRHQPLQRQLTRRQLQRRSHSLLGFKGAHVVKILTAVVIIRVPTHTNPRMCRFPMSLVNRSRSDHETFKK